MDDWLSTEDPRSPRDSMSHGTEGVPTSGECGQDLVKRPRNIQRKLEELATPDTRVRALATCAVCRLGERMHTQIDRMEYFRTLIHSACAAAIDPEHEPTSLRAERRHVGVDFPELDTVPLWTSVTGDGKISVPFLEFIVIGIEAELSCFSRNPRLRRDELRPVKQALGGLDKLLRQAAPDGVPGDGLPRLREVFVDPNYIMPLCEPGGLLDQAIGACRRCCERSEETCG